MTTKAKKIVSTTAIGSEVEKRFSLMNIIYTRLSLTGHRMSDLMVICLLGKELADRDATPFVKILSTTGQPKQKPRTAFCETQLVYGIYNGVRVSYFL